MGKYRKKEWNPKIVVEYVPFPNERARQRAYEQYADTILAGYRNLLKYEKEKAEKEGREFNLEDLFKK